MTDWGTIVGDRKTWMRDIVFTAATSLAFAFIAPAGQNGLPLQQRVIENFALGFGTFFLLWPPMRAALRFGTRAGLPELFVIVAGLVVLTLPVALVSSLIAPRFLPPGPPPPPLIQIYFLVLAMTLPVGAAYLMVDRRLFRPTEPATRHAVASPDAPPRLLARLPPRLGREVLALQGEDHYVRVYTPLGSELLLMRLGDAVDEVGGLAGERVHRSWWVARTAVKDVRPAGRRLSLILSNGLEVPVTRETSAKLRREGWLRG